MTEERAPNGISPRVWKLFLATVGKVNRLPAAEQDQWSTLIRSSNWSLPSIEAWRQQHNARAKAEERATAAQEETIAVRKEAAAERSHRGGKPQHSERDAEIIAMKQDGKKVERIANHFKMTVDAVYKVLKRKTDKTVPAN